MSTEYQVRPVTRYVVTRYEAASNQDGSQAGAASSVIGEFANGNIADDVADGMVAKDIAAGIKSQRSRHGLTLGEVISGSRIDQPGKTLKIKMHRGSLAGSMETAEQIEPTAKAVMKYLALHGIQEGQNVSVRPYGRDDRIGWDVYLVTVAGLGVVAMTDGPLKD